MKINLNADMGESFGAYTMGEDERLIRSISSANIACGFHGGDADVMHHTIELAQTNGVSIGAHPSFLDLQGFGRRQIQLSERELYNCVVYQIGALQGIAQTCGAKVTHVKPHGAMNNMACENRDMATVIAKAVYDLDRNLVLLAPALSELVKAGKKQGLNVAQEIFADRAYDHKGMLVSRKIKGSVIHESVKCLERVEKMLEEQALVTIDNTLLACEIHSICVHGDTLSACETAEFLKKGLEKKGYILTPLDQFN